MKKVIQLAAKFWARIVAVFAAIARFGKGCFTKACGLACFKGEGKACDMTRAGVAGMILFGIAGAGMGASGGISAYGVAKTAAGATVSVGWDSNWLLWTIVWSATGAGVGAATALLARFLSAARGPRIALMSVGLLGGVFAGATWGSAVARERVVEVRAQTATAAPIAVGDGAKLSVVNGPVRLTGSVARDLNGLLLAFMLGSGALVGVLAARGLSTPNGAAGIGENEIPMARPFQPKGQPKAA
jgi:hypothetical protein